MVLPSSCLGRRMYRGIILYKGVVIIRICALQQLKQLLMKRGTVLLGINILSNPFECSLASISNRSTNHNGNLSLIRRADKIWSVFFVFLPQAIHPRVLANNNWTFIRKKNFSLASNVQFFRAFAHLFRSCLFFALTTIDFLIALLTYFSFFSCRYNVDFENFFGFSAKKV